MFVGAGCGANNKEVQMKFIDLMSVTHTTDIVIYDGYNGIDEKPVMECHDGSTICAARSKYDGRHVSVIEAVGDTLYVWLADDVSRLRELANKLLNQVCAYESDDFEVASIMRHFGYDKDELKMLGVGNKELYEAMR